MPSLARLNSPRDDLWNRYVLGTSSRRVKKLTTRQFFWPKPSVTSAKLLAVFIWISTRANVGSNIEMNIDFHSLEVRPYWTRMFWLLAFKVGNMDRAVCWVVPHYECGFALLRVDGPVVRFDQNWWYEKAHCFCLGHIPVKLKFQNFFICTD